MRAFLFLVLLAAPVLKAWPADRPPNFVVIFCDDMGYGDLSSFGHPMIRTPHLDRMAAEGQKWTEFYVADPVCTPSRAALLTGRYPIRNGMTSSKRSVLFPNSTGGLPESEITIAEVLKERGYATAAIGKWHLGHLPQFLPTNQGFDSYYGIPYSNDMDLVRGRGPRYHDAKHDPEFMPSIASYNVPLMENETIIERPADQTTITRRYTDRALAAIETHRERPFFIYLAHSLPHVPLFASPEFRGRSPRGLYGDVIEEIDAGVGRIVEKLRELDLAENTLVVFTSDNGPWLLFETHGGSAGPLRAGKGTTFEGGQRVPTIMWGPKWLRPGIVTGMGATLDLINTFAALAGTSVPTDRKMDGYDLTPVLRGAGPSPREKFFYWTRAELYAVRSGPWKLHIKQREPVRYSNEVQLEHPELYHLGLDVAEAYDRSTARPDVVQNLLALLDAHRADVSDAMPDQLAARIQP